MTISEPAVLLEHYPLSAAQRRLWFVAQLNPDSCAYNNAHLIRFHGQLDGDRLIAALHAVIARHDSLRMRFAGVDGPGSDIVAIVAPALSIAVPYVDWSTSVNTGHAEAERQFVRELAREPFDLATGPLVRAALVRVDASRHVFAIVFHHIISDRWSYGVLMRELAAFYAACDGELAVVPPLRTNYGECSQAEADQAEMADADLDYWRTVLAGDRPELELPADRARRRLGAIGARSLRRRSPSIWYDAWPASGRSKRRRRSWFFRRLLRFTSAHDGPNGPAGRHAGRRARADRT